MNPYLKRLDELEAARKAWRESEWVLNFLRTIQATPPPEPNDEEMLQWYRSIPIQ